MKEYVWPIQREDLEAWSVDRRVLFEVLKMKPQFPTASLSSQTSDENN